jgi:hypothetical protein
MLQVQEAKDIGIEGEVKPEISRISWARETVFAKSEIC